jgi:hypothetical protein
MSLAALIKLLENSACSSEVLAEVGENVFPIEFKEEGMMMTTTKKDMMTTTKKDMMTTTKKDMMTTKVMATELMTLTFGLIQIELPMQLNILKAN